MPSSAWRDLSRVKLDKASPGDRACALQSRLELNYYTLTWLSRCGTEPGVTHVYQILYRFLPGLSKFNPYKAFQGKEVGYVQMTKFMTGIYEKG